MHIYHLLPSITIYFDLLFFILPIPITSHLFLQLCILPQQNAEVAKKLKSPGPKLEPRPRPGPRPGPRPRPKLRPRHRLSAAHHKEKRDTQHTAHTTHTTHTQLTQPTHNTHNSHTTPNNNQSNTSQTASTTASWQVPTWCQEGFGGAQEAKQVLWQIWFSEQWGPEALQCTAFRANDEAAAARALVSPLALE